MKKLIYLIISFFASSFAIASDGSWVALTSNSTVLSSANIAYYSAGCPSGYIKTETNPAYPGGDTGTIYCWAPTPEDQTPCDESTGETWSNDQNSCQPPEEPTECPEQGSSAGSINYTSDSVPSCIGGCQVTSVSVHVILKSGEAYGEFAYTSATCSGSENGGNQNDGSPSDAPDYNYEGNDSNPDNDGDGIDNSNDSDVDGDGNPNGTDDDIDGDGIGNSDDPNPWGEDDGSSDSATTSSVCTAPPSCEGDAIQCAILIQQWQSSCKILDELGANTTVSPPEKGTFDISDIQAKVEAKKTELNTEFSNIKSQIDTALGVHLNNSGAIQPNPVSTRWGDFDMSFFKFKDHLDIIGGAIILIAYFIGFMIILRD